MPSTWWVVILYCYTLKKKSKQKRCFKIRIFESMIFLVKRKLTERRWENSSSHQAYWGKIFVIRGSTRYIIHANDIWGHATVISKLLKCPQGSRRITLSILLILTLSTVNINELTNGLYPSLSLCHSGNVLWCLPQMALEWLDVISPTT